MNSGPLEKRVRGGVYSVEFSAAPVDCYCQYVPLELNESPSQLSVLRKMRGRANKPYTVFAAQIQSSIQFCHKIRRVRSDARFHGEKWQFFERV